MYHEQNVRLLSSCMQFILKLMDNSHMMQRLREFGQPFRFCTRTRAHTHTQYMLLLDANVI